MRTGEFDLKSQVVGNGPITAWRVNIMPIMGNQYTSSVGSPSNLVQKVALVPITNEYWLEITTPDNLSRNRESGLYTKRTESGKEEFVSEAQAIRGTFAAKTYFDSEQSAINAAVEVLTERCKTLTETAKNFVKPIK